MKDYYLILGVLPDAEDVVIKAAYKALVQRYHPDRFKGSAEEAQRRTRELNEAYEVLSNPAKRADYDRQRQAQKNGSTSDYDEDEAGAEDLNDALEMMAADWRFALDYYPDLAQLEANLQRLSSKLGLAFKLVMLSDKQFDKRSQVAKALENKFLETHFGSNKEVQALAKRFILDRNQAAARELNKAVVILGSKSDPRQLISRMWQKYYPKETYVYAREKSGVEQKLDTTITTVKQLFLKLLAIGFVGFLILIAVGFVIELSEKRELEANLKQWEQQRLAQEKLEQEKKQTEKDEAPQTVQKELTIQPALPGRLSKETGRWLNLESLQSGEKLSVVYKRNGQLDMNGYRKVCAFMRDVKADKASEIDLRLLDILDGIRAALVQAGVSNPTFVVHSAFLSNPTSMEHSSFHQNAHEEQEYHLKGQAIDFYVPGVPSHVLFKWMQQVKFHDGIGMGFYEGDPSWIHLDSRSVGKSVFWEE